MALLNKSIDFASKGRPLSILSATCSESTEGWIYVEAFKEIHIKQACQNLHFCFNKYILLPQEQMTDVYSNDKAKHNELKMKQWVRIKNGGIYNGDIGLVEGVQESKVFVRLIPRVDLSNADKASSRFVRVPQRIGYQPPKELATYQARIHDILNKNMTEYKRMLFYRGFLFKAFPFKQVESTPNIKPTHEELQNFSSTIQKSTAQNNFNTDDCDDDDKVIEDVIRKTMMKGGTTFFTKGDKIRVHKGDLTGIKGTVISIEEGGLVTFKPMNLAELKRPLQIDISMLTKYFEPGDLVRVTEGKYKGDTGQVIDVDPKNNSVSVVLDQSQQEIRIIAN
jgi:transcription elongation factor SPT5